MNWSEKKSAELTTNGAIVVSIVGLGKKLI